MILESFAFILVSLVVLVYLLYQFFVYRQTSTLNQIRSKTTGQSPPQEDVEFPFGTIPELYNIYSIAEKRSERFRKWGIFVTTLFFKPICMIFDPKIAFDVHNRGEENFVRCLRGLFGIWVGPALLGASGEDWKRQHRILQKAFTTGHISNFVPDIVDVMLSKKSYLDDAAQNQKVIDVTVLFTETASDVLTTTSMAGDLAMAARIRESFGYLATAFRWPLWRIAAYKNLTFIPSVTKTLNEMQTLENITRQILNERRAKIAADPTKTKYLIDLLNNARDDDSGLKLTDEEIITNALTFFVAGTHTTSTLLSFMCSHLVTHPDIYDRVQKEIDTVIPDDLSQLTIKEISQLSYFNQVMNETLRLTPPIGKTPDRILANDLEAGGWTLSKGTSLSLDILAAHRNPDHFPNPDKFDPGRWEINPTEKSVDLDDMSPEERERKKLEPFKFIPFGAGRRVCIGKYFVLLETRVVMSVLLKLYKLKKAPNVEFPRKVRVSLVVCEPLDGVPLLFEKR